MNRFGAAALVILAMSVAGCGNPAHEKELQSKVDACSALKDAADAKVKELEATLALVTKERDDLKAAAVVPEAVATPAPAPKAAAKATPKPAPTATVAPATPAPTPTPTPGIPKKIKLPGRAPN